MASAGAHSTLHTRSCRRILSTPSTAVNDLPSETAARGADLSRASAVGHAVERVQAAASMPPTSGPGRRPRGHTSTRTERCPLCPGDGSSARGPPSRLDSPSPPRGRRLRWTQRHATRRRCGPFARRCVAGSSSPAIRRTTPTAVSSIGTPAPRRGRRESCAAPTRTTPSAPSSSHADTASRSRCAPAGTAISRGADRMGSSSTWHRCVGSRSMRNGGSCMPRRACWAARWPWPRDATVSCRCSGNVRESAPWA